MLLPPARRLRGWGRSTAALIPRLIALIVVFIKRPGLDLMADGARRVLSYRIEKSGVVAVHVIAGCPGGQSRKNALA